MGMDECLKMGYFAWNLQWREMKNFFDQVRINERNDFEITMKLSDRFLLC